MKAILIQVLPAHPHFARSLLVLVLTSAAVLATLWLVRTVPMESTFRLLLMAAVLFGAFTVRRRVVGTGLRLSRMPDQDAWHLHFDDINGRVAMVEPRDGGIEFEVAGRRARIAPPQVHAGVIPLIAQVLDDPDPVRVATASAALDPAQATISIHDSPKSLLLQIRDPRSIQRPFLWLTAASIAAICVLVWAT